MATFLNGTLVAGSDSRARARDGELLAFEWTAAKPAPLTYARTGTWYLIDNAAQSHVTSYGAGVWGAETQADGTLRVPVHVGYTNLITAPRDLSAWVGADAKVTTDVAAGPDGTVAADRYNQVDASAAVGNQPASSAGTAYVITLWVQTASGTAPYQVSVGGATTTAWGFAAGTATTTWQRVALKLTPADANVTMAWQDTRHFHGSISGTGPDGVTAATWTNIGATDARADLAMWIPSRFVRPHTDGTVGSSILSLPGSSVVAPNGRFDVTLTTGVLEHLWSAANITAVDQYLFYIDANNHVRIDHTDQKLKLKLGGTDRVVSSALSYSGPHNVGGVRVWSRGDGCGFAYDGVTTTGSAQAALAVPGTVYLLSNNGNNVFSSHLQVGAGARFIARHPR